MGRTKGGNRGRGRGRGRPRRPPKEGRGRGRPRKYLVVESDESDDEEEQKVETVDNMAPTTDDEYSAYLMKIKDEKQDTIKIETPEKPMPILKAECNLEVKVERPDPIETPELPMPILKAECNLEVKVERPDPIETPELPVLKTEFKSDIDGDISQLSLVPFTKGPPNPMLGLDWNQRYTPIGEIVRNPKYHMCEVCRLPILLYGRMIPCKHVLCWGCSTAPERLQCPRCSEKICWVILYNIGSLHMCLYDGSRYGYDGCRRTYLFEKDLKAHILRRHMPPPSQNAPYYGGQSTITGPGANRIESESPTPFSEMERETERERERDACSECHGITCPNPTPPPYWPRY